MSSPADPIQQPVEAKGQQAATAKKNPEAKGNRSLPPNVVPSPKHQAESCHCKPDMTPLWKIILECGAVAVGIIVAIIYYAQWHAMDESLKIDQRAWLKPSVGPPWDKTENWSGSLDNLEKIEIPLTLKNIGKTPATGVIIDTSIEVLGFDEQPKFRSEGYTYYHVTMNLIYPEDQQPFNAGLLPGTPPGPGIASLPITLDPATREALKKGDKYLVVIAEGDYSDSFGRYFFQYCLPMAFNKNRASPFKSCVEFNQTGKR